MFQRILSLCLCTICCYAPAEDEYERAPISYSAAQAKDAVAALSKKPVSWTREGTNPLLRQLMKQLGIPEASQVLVFSKTSAQNNRISPATPRAIWFGDEAYLGYAQGGLIELSAIDPVLGPVFYTLDPNEPASKPLSFQRDQSCLSCHGGTFTDGIPGVLVRSVTPSSTGHPIFNQGSTVVDWMTPFEKRWGGWYVTGKHGAGVHRGNTLGKEEGEGVHFDPTDGQNVTKLGSYFDSRGYLRESSDIVALMILEHQTGTQNVLTRAQHSAMRAVEMQRSLAKELGEPVPASPTGTALRIIQHAAEDVLDALLFRDEAALPSGGIEGDAEFVQQFSANARKAKDGRSLKDLQCLERLFKYRCSYLIYGTMFKALQPDLKAAVMARLELALAGADERYSYLKEAERGHIKQILADTL
jgi:hypothetical protein